MFEVLRIFHGEVIAEFQQETQAQNQSTLTLAEAKISTENGCTSGIYRLLVCSCSETLHVVWKLGNMIVQTKSIDKYIVKRMETELMRLGSDLMLLARTINHNHRGFEPWGEWEKYRIAEDGPPQNDKFWDLEPAGEDLDTEWLHNFFKLLDTSPDQPDILVRKDSLVQQIWQTFPHELLSECPIPSAELWKGFDRDNRRDQLKVGQLTLDSIAKSGKYRAKCLAVQVKALIWLDDLWDVEEIKKASSEIMQMLETPERQMRNDKADAKSDIFWNALAFSGCVLAWLLEYRQKHAAS
ncbi:hypothetical protein LTS17_012827 [Exophiala oligosperma]